MTKRLFLFVLICLAATVCVSAQTRTVTNVDLEKYRQQRLQADREYRENYARLGLPSPDEIDRRLEERRNEMEKLSDKLRVERLAQERLDASLEQQRSQLVYGSTPNYYTPEYDGGFLSSGYGIRNRGFRRVRQFRQPSGYFAGGQFWESPPPAIYPAFRPQRTPRQLHR